MQIETVPIQSLVFDPANARTHSEKNIDAIRSSLARFGQQKPIVVDADNVVIAGNGTLEAAKSLGWSELTIHRTDLTGPEAIAFAIADNRTAELADWEKETLGAHLQGLREDGWELEELGFELKDLEEFNAAPPPYEGQTDEDETPEVDGNPFEVQRGDIWLLGEHRVMCGDSTDPTDVGKLMAGEKADMVFTDPPYGVDYEGIHNDSREGLEELLRGSFAAMEISPGAPVYMFHSDRCADIFHKTFREFCHFSSILIWVKPALVLSQTDYQSRHEPCLYGWALGGTHKWYGDRKQTSVMEIGKERVDGHTTPKPVGFIEVALSNSSKAGTLVNDPFLGSGSTLIACEKTKRRCFGMEIDPHYVSVIIKRWQDFTGKEAKRGTPSMGAE